MCDIGAPEGYLEGILGGLEGSLGPPWVIFGNAVGSSWRYLGRTLGILGSTLGAFSATSGQYFDNLESILCDFG